MEKRVGEPYLCTSAGISSTPTDLLLTSFSLSKQISPVDNGSSSTNQTFNWKFDWKYSEHKSLQMLRYISSCMFTVSFINSGGKLRPYGIRRSEFFPETLSINICKLRSYSLQFNLDFILELEQDFHMKTLLILDWITSGRWLDTGKIYSNL